MRAEAIPFLRNLPDGVLRAVEYTFFAVTALGAIVGVKQVTEANIIDSQLGSQRERMASQFSQEWIDSLSVDGLRFYVRLNSMIPGVRNQYVERRIRESRTEETANLEGLRDSSRVKGAAGAVTGLLSLAAGCLVGYRKNPPAS